MPSAPCNPNCPLYAIRERFPPNSACVKCRQKSAGNVVAYDQTITKPAVSDIQKGRG